MIFKLPFFSLSPSLFPTSNHCSELLLLQPISAIFFEPVHSVVELSMLPFEVCLSSSPFFYGIDIDYAQFFIFLSLFFVCFGFWGF